ncbi:MAG: OsmC family protein [Granulosicoccus sp.]
MSDSKLKVNKHEYTSTVTWTGNTGAGTSAYRAYERTWDIQTPGKPVVHCSNDPLLGGDPCLPNPEDLLLSAVSACHMLWYLHLASNAGIIVQAYTDSPIGTGEVASSGAGRFISVTLRPTITLSESSDVGIADALHADIHQYCFIARSLNFPVKFDATYKVA